MRKIDSLFTFSYIWRIISKYNNINNQLYQHRNEVFKIKKLLSLFLTAAICLSLSACAGKPGDTAANSGTDETQSKAPTVVEQREYNYLTGRAFTEGQDKTARPIAVMINNARLAMPQSGLESADVIYEMVTEGGITRLMALYSDINTMGTVGPVRSARDQFVQFLLPLNAIYVHIGTSIYAKDMLNFYSYQDIDGLYLGTTSFDFDRERNKTVGSEHCWYTKPNLILDGIAATNINVKGNLYPAFNFADYKEAPITLDAGKDATEIYFKFSDYADAAMSYNQAEKRYYKSSLGAPQIDQQTGTQVSFDNFVMLVTDITLKPDQLCTEFDLTQGTGYYFYGGKYTPVKWVKGAPESPLQLFDEKDNPISINVGKTYVAIIGADAVETMTITGAVQTVAESGADPVAPPAA